MQLIMCRKDYPEPRGKRELGAAPRKCPLWSPHLGSPNRRKLTALLALRSILFTLASKDAKPSIVGNITRKHHNTRITK